MTLTDLSLKEVVTCAINHIEIGGEDKQEIINQVVGYVETHYISTERVKEVVPNCYIEKL